MKIRRNTRKEALRVADVRVTLEDRGEAGRVARVTLDNSSKLNTISTPLIEKLTKAIGRLQDDEALRVVVLTGAGDRAFIGGVDIDELITLDKARAAAFITRLHRLCEAVRNVPVPVIAQIQGYCLGGGLEIAASCDMRVASEDAKFGMPEVNVGIPSVIEAALLPRLIGWGKTCELVYTGRMISAQEALGAGLIERAVPSDQLNGAVEEWVGSILKAGPRAIRLQKTLLGEWEKLPLEEAVERGVTCFAEAYETNEPQKRMERFMQRQKERSSA
jgi:enoyl-CoA hydratase